MTRSSRFVLLALLTTTVGCAFDPGEPFATVRPLLKVGYVVPEDRARPEGFARLASDYEVKLSEVTLAVEELALVEERQTAATGGGGDQTFDPANPPAGYSNCHGGHCHRDDGALIAYEDIQAELSGGAGGTASVTLMTFTVEESFDALSPTERDLRCEPDCGLELVTVESLRAHLSQLTLRGTVRDTRMPPRIAETAFVFAVSEPPGLALRQSLLLPADREHFPTIRLEAALAPQPRVFDGVPWAELARGVEGIDLGAAENDAARLAILDALGETALAVEAVRSP